MSENKIEISVKDIPEIIEQLKDLEKELELERKSKNLFIDDLYKVCEMSLKLQNQLQQKEDIIKEVRKYIENDLQISILPNNQIINGTEVVKRINYILGILDKGSDKE